MRHVLDRAFGALAMTAALLSCGGGDPPGGGNGDTSDGGKTPGTDGPHVPNPNNPLIQVIPGTWEMVEWRSLYSSSPDEWYPAAEGLTGLVTVAPGDPSCDEHGSAQRQGDACMDLSRLVPLLIPAFWVLNGDAIYAESDRLSGNPNFIRRVEGQVLDRGWRIEIRWQNYVAETGEAQTTNILDGQDLRFRKLD